MRAKQLVGLLFPAMAGCHADKDAGFDSVVDSAAGADTADTVTVDSADSADSAPPDSADTANDTAIDPPMGRDVTWGGFGDDADLRITACGSLLGNSSPGSCNQRWLG